MFLKQKILCKLSLTLFSREHLLASKKRKKSKPVLVMNPSGNETQLSYSTSCIPFLVFYFGNNNNFSNLCFSFFSFFCSLTR